MGTIIAKPHIQALAEQFSKQGKIEKANYLAQEPTNKENLTQIAKELAAIHLAPANDDEKKAFFINIYNGFTNYLIVNKGLSGGLITNLTMFFFPKLVVGGLKFSLDDIEHGILRSNRKASYKFSKQFGKDDPRLKYKVNKIDYRIHFALNCGAVSCPPIAFYSSDKIDQQLSLAEQSFAEQNFVIDHKSKTIRYSKLYAVYKEDFKNLYLNDRQYNEYKFKSMKYDTNFG